MRDIKLSNLRVCLEVLRRGNLTATAQALNMTQSAVSKSVQSVEAHLGKPLFRRGKAGMAAYDYAQSFLAKAAEGIGIIDTAIMSLSETDGKGALRVVAPPIIAQRFIIPHLEEFSQRHPGLELLFRVRTSSTRRNADTDAEIAFSGNGAPPGAQWLVGGHFWVVCHPTLVPGRFPLDSVAGYPLLQHIKLEQAWLMVAERRGLNFTKTKFHYYEQYNLIIDAVLQKQGIAIMPRFLVSEAVRAGHLRRIGEEIAFPNVGYHFVVVRSEKAAASRKLFRWLHHILQRADRA